MSQKEMMQFIHKNGNFCSKNNTIIFLYFNGTLTVKELLSKCLMTPNSRVLGTIVDFLFSIASLF